MKQLAFLFLVSTGLSFAATETWTIDDTHSTGRFKVKHMLITNVSGEVGGVTGKFTVDGDDLTKMTIDAKADMRTISTNNKQRDEHLRGDDFFSVKKFPTTTFKSKKVVKEGEKYKITGDLTLHGVTKEVVLETDGLTPAVKDPWGATRRGFVASTKINRKDYAVNWGKVLDNGGAVVSDDVEITFEAELKSEAPKAAKEENKAAKAEKKEKKG